MSETRQLFSQREAAIYLGIDRRKLSDLRESGHFNTFQLKKIILYSRKELDDFKEKFIELIEVPQIKIK